MARETTKDVKAAETLENKVEAVQASKKEQKILQESVYPAGELAVNAKKVFGTRQECVMAALKAAGKMECTVFEAKEIVKKFLAKEVR